MNNKRISKVSRKTKETDIQVEFNIDGKGNSDIKTGIGFFDHVLDGFCRHGLFDLNIKATGDLYVDAHHTIEDTGIVLGNAIREAAGDKSGISRFGNMILPMDEALVLCAIDFSGRPYLSFDMDIPCEMIGQMPSEMVKEFFYAISYTSMMNIHIKQISGDNSHHLVEAAFKAFGKSLCQALTISERIEGVISTKGTL
ncbi:imidazoleglycerol-phosphate dehydratase [Acetitomaculum ruminis DSM 5522]|uniref:Imidazoleglycerol-phosphate dehydratase n=1 Tax=Acetitomaculum ruminis DSM 5522 TaxID=1120918 RepID=A0A1I0VAN1_9FIRM|nr:imidazoleglycerol-phosphate dehydratase HisB [Acetitomaculum ruminis]SFA73083.1 imidazoleglycerol-phosphate dehydratase [Acetitomaculum ruminis DSM 5522]